MTPTKLNGPGSRKIPHLAANCSTVSSNPCLSSCSCIGPLGPLNPHQISDLGPGLSLWLHYQMLMGFISRCINVQGIPPQLGPFSISLPLPLWPLPPSRPAYWVGGIPGRDARPQGSPWPSPGKYRSNWLKRGRWTDGQMDKGAGFPFHSPAHRVHHGLTPSSALMLLFMERKVPSLKGGARWRCQGYLVLCCPWIAGAHFFGCI